MTRSKILTILCTLAILAAGLWYALGPAAKLENEETLGQDAEFELVNDNPLPESFGRDIERLERDLPAPEQIDSTQSASQVEKLSAAWRELKDFTRSADEIVKEENASAIKEQIKVRVPAIMECLKKDLCGTTKESPEETYFDELHTPAHALLERLFEANLAAIEVSGTSALADEVLLAAFRDTNETVQGLALEAYLSGSSEPAKINEVLAREEAFSGDGAAKLYQILLGTGGIEDESRAEVLERFAAKLLEGDPLTHIALAESLQQLGLTSNEAERLLPALCRFHQDSDNTQNWTVVRFHIKAIGLSPDSCP